MIIQVFAVFKRLKLGFVDGNSSFIQTKVINILTNYHFIKLKILFLSSQTPFSQDK